MATETSTKETDIECKKADNEKNDTIEQWQRSCTFGGMCYARLSLEYWTRWLTATLV